MAKRKKSEENSLVDSTIKVKTLFDHLNAITYVQDPNYWSTLTDSDKKTWNTYMINRYLSMNMDLTETIAYLDKYTVTNGLKPEYVYKLYINILPKSKQYLSYVKSNNSIKYNKELINMISNHYKVSNREAIDYLTIFYLNEKHKNDLLHLLSMYGLEQKEIKKLIKI